MHVDWTKKKQFPVKALHFVNTCRYISTIFLLKFWMRNDLQIEYCEFENLINLDVAYVPSKIVYF